MKIGADSGNCRIGLRNLDCNEWMIIRSRSAQTQTVLASPRTKYDNDMDARAENTMSITDSYNRHVRKAVLISYRWSGEKINQAGGETPSRGSLPQCKLEDDYRPLAMSTSSIPQSFIWNGFRNEWRVTLRSTRGLAFVSVLGALYVTSKVHGAVLGPHRAKVLVEPCMRLISIQ